MSATTAYTPFEPIEPTRPAYRRTRASSLLSTTSGISIRTAHELVKSRPTAIVVEPSEKHDVWGSFVPMNSAAVSLRKIVSKPHPKRLKVTLFEKRLTMPIYDPDSEDTPPTSPIPHITRTLTYHSVQRSPHPTSSAIFTVQEIPEPHIAKTTLHPVLANLERKSKLISPKADYCSTCKKPGRDFPRCGKCQNMWCSRECRLMGGRRHFCGSNNNAP